MSTFADNPAARPIRELLLDPTVTEIMVNGPDQVFLEREGRMQLADERFRDAEQLMGLIEVLLRPSGRVISSTSPYMDFRLPDGSRGNVIIPPAALNGPVLTIRKFTRQLTSVISLIEAGTLTERMAHLLAVAVEGRANIIFSGATGTGKTTTLGIFSRYIPEGERIITIEDTAEIQLPQRHVVRLECRPPNLEGKGEINMSDLVRNSLRMRPTRIIVGEIRGQEVIDMIQAISTGHHGCLAVLHASSPTDVISRLELMSLSRGLLLPLWAIHKQIASTIDLIVQHELLGDGSRKVTRMTEVAGVQDDRIVLRDLFEYRRLGVNQHGRIVGEWTCSGVRPGFLERCEKRGVELPAGVLAPGADR